MRQREKGFKRFLSVMLSAALTVTSGAFGALQTNSTLAKAADKGVPVPNTGWTLYADDIAVDSAGVQYKWNENNKTEAKVVGVTSSFSSSKYEIPSSIPVTYAMYQALYLNSGSAASGETNVTVIANEAFLDAASLEKVKISEGIKKIGRWAFDRLSQLEIPKSVSYADIGCNTDQATDSTKSEILNAKVDCKVYCWKGSDADIYFHDKASEYPAVTVEYLDTLPDVQPTVSPSASPSAVPSTAPTASPSAEPSAVPSTAPTASPSAEPSAVPSMLPTASPSAAPVTSPTVLPSAEPTASPSAVPGTSPAVSPSVIPSVQPTANTPAGPGVRPSGRPIVVPSATPAPVATSVPAVSASPVASAVPVPSYNPSATVAPDSTETPAVTTPTEVPDDDIFHVSYEIDQNKDSVAVTDMRDVKTSTVKIPATVTVDGKEYPVTKIGKNAFAGNKHVKTVTLGSNVKTIGTGAFKGCTNLTSVKFPSKLATVGKNSFYNCKKLKKASLPVTTKKIGTAAFKNCKALKQFVVGKKLRQKKGALPAGAQEIRYGASSVKLDISASAFENCVSLRQMVINSLVRRIGNSALKNCKSLRSLIVNSEILKEVAKRALKGVHNCKISVPSMKLKPYSVLFKNKGQGKKVIVAKI